MKYRHALHPPTKKQQIILQSMIVIGFCTMFFFLFCFLNKLVIVNAFLFWLLLISFLFTCLKVTYEWYHYLFITVKPEPPITQNYTVDIFTTFCAGEPYEMIVETLKAIQEITYPHTTYLCDEADDAYLKKICAELGVRHVTRTDKKDAKAGNINNALAQSTGELCVVLDPDHVPPPSFLNPIVGHFDNPEIGFVQIVQAYSNQTESRVAKGAAQQTYHFYGPMMMTMNRYGTVPAIGANCTFRRTALESIGGHASGLAEDMHTAMRLHAQGWKSVFEPSMLTRGLVPATLSAYYKQQLKWSRGVFELLVTSYVELFSKFSWRQKLHYGIVPLYYLSGLIFAINLLLPILSLFTQTFPIKIDFLVFAQNSTPFVLSIILIRHYVQRWVIDDTERGFHVVGGLLLIGTWWVFNLGLIYTIIRKEVPYIPTEKSIKEGGSIKINLPNIIILLLSIAAIVYGLYHDLNPFTIIMACFAGLNVVFLTFTLVISEEIRLKSLINQHYWLKILYEVVFKFRIKFWFFRRKIYHLLRNTALILLVLFISFTIFINETSLINKQQSVRIIPKKNTFLTGIFAPEQTDGLSSLKLVRKYQSKYQSHFDIISFYISWGNQEKNYLPIQKIDSVFQNNSIPMITWEPWQMPFEDESVSISENHENKVFKKISDGKFDVYIEQFALQLKALNRPVFLRFAHEPDNLFYPWSVKGNNTPEEFKNAWRYLFMKFKKMGIYNVIWVWSPWKVTAVKDYFPGKDYVDWIGITGLNYGQFNTQNPSYSFEEIYQPFHKNPIFKLGIPVMIAEMGSLKKTGHKQDVWVKTAINKIKSKYPEVRAYVFFNSSLDKNMPDGSIGLLDWQLKNIPKIKAGLPKQKYTPLIQKKGANTMIVATDIASTDSSKMFLGTKGVNYLKGKNWFKNINPLTKKVIESDFATMKLTGVNTVKISGPNIYDRNMLNVAKNSGLKIHYSFWVPEALRFIKNERELNRLSMNILETISMYKNDSSIVSWNISNNTLQQLELNYYKPELLYQQQAYFRWLRNLIQKIKKIDSKRIVTVDVAVTSNIAETLNMIKNQVPEIDCFGLILSDKADFRKHISKISLPYFFSQANVKAYLKLSEHKVGVIIENWQDQQSAYSTTFNGLKDEKGRNKESLFQLSELWHGKIKKNDLPPVKILRPALTTVANTVLPYYALVYKNEHWHLAEYFKTGLSFEWYLVETDENGVAISQQLLGNGAYINVKIPENVSRYRLYLIASQGENIRTSQSILNIPL